MPANDSSDPEIVALMARIEEYRRAYNVNQDSARCDGVAHLYRGDDDFTAFDVAPPLGGYVGWKIYSGGWQHVMNKYREIHFEFRNDLRVFRKGDVGWCSFSADWYGKTAAGDDFAKEIRQTMVWVKVDGEWKVTQEHGSSPKTFTLPGGEVV